MSKERKQHAVKHALENYHCGMCETGVVQIYSYIRSSVVTSKISGCLDCGAEYGIRQATRLEKYNRDDMTCG